MFPSNFMLTQKFFFARLGYEVGLRSLSLLDLVFGTFLGTYHHTTAFLPTYHDQHFVGHTQQVGTLGVGVGTRRRVGKD